MSSFNRFSLDLTIHGGSGAIENVGIGNIKCFGRILMAFPQLALKSASDTSDSEKAYFKVVFNVVRNYPVK
jgi:hypothetical protein